MAAAPPTVHQAREVHLGGELVVRRLLPRPQRRLVGPWCFFDHFGPATLGEGGMDVAPHPHTGLQTVTWLLEGRVLHLDSLGSEQTIAPGQLNLMTSGRGISHAEVSPPGFSGPIHGVQLWVAMPESDRHGPAAFEHHSVLPRTTVGPAEVTVFMGSAFGLTSPGTAFSPMVGADVHLPEGGAVALPVDGSWEHALTVVEGTAEVAGEPVRPGKVVILDPGAAEIEVRADAGARLILLGGAPFGESILMWWNFVARTPAEMAEVREAWQAEDARFGSVEAYPGGRLDAPPLDRARWTRDG